MAPKSGMVKSKAPVGNVGTNKESTSGGTRQVAVLQKKVSSSPVEIKMDEEGIKQIAYLFAREGKTWDECTWILADNELRFGGACAQPKSDFKYGGLPKKVKIVPSRIIPALNQEEVQKLAFEISQRGPSLQDLHWFIAQRLFIKEYLTKNS